MFDLKPSIDIKYPPFKNGLYLEEYFDKYWQSQNFPQKDRFIYLDVYWHNLFHKHGPNIINSLKDWVYRICEKAKYDNKIIFTIYQWDDLFMDGHKPDNLLIFTIGNYLDIPLPLIVEDRSYKLQHLPKIHYKDKKILCSFTGTITHSVREKMVRELQNIPGFVFYTQKDWNINVSTDLMELFINTLSQSKFALAPRGYGCSSFRFFEIMEMDTVPIYIYDSHNCLPFQDIIDYSKCSIVIHSDEIHRLPDILNNITDEQYENMLKEIRKVKIWFSPEGVCYYIRDYLVRQINKI